MTSHIAAGVCYAFCEVACYVMPLLCVQNCVGSVQISQHSCCLRLTTKSCLFGGKYFSYCINTHYLYFSVVDATTYIYFTCFHPLVYGTFLREFFK